MLKLFIAKLSIYANCVPRSQSFYCRIKMSLLFNARAVSSGCCSFQAAWLLCAVRQRAASSRAGVTVAPAAGTSLNGVPGPVSVPVSASLPAGSGVPRALGKPGAHSAVPGSAQRAANASLRPAAALPAGRRLSRSRCCAQVSTRQLGMEFSGIPL